MKCLINVIRYYNFSLEKQQPNKNRTKKIYTRNTFECCRYN